MENRYTVRAIKLNSGYAKVKAMSLKEKLLKVIALTKKGANHAKN